MVLGLDIGGTKTAFAFVDAEGAVLARGRLPTGASPHETLRRLSLEVKELRRASGLGERLLEGIGVGCCGPLDPRRGIILTPPNLPGWRDFSLTQALEDALGTPALLDNDANVAAVGEHRFGAGRGVDNLVYVTLSTGVGGGIILGGRLYVGENGNAGEIGHMTVAFDGRPCRCGSRGCLEAYASGSAIAERALERVRDALSAGRSTLLSASAASPPSLTSADVVAAVRAGDAVARELWEETLRILGAGLANVIHAFNPRRVVVGGGLTAAGDTLFATLPAQTLSRVMPALAAVVEVVPASLGEDVGLLGAAALVWAAKGAKVGSAMGGSKAGSNGA